MLTITADKILPCTITGSWPRPHWFDMSMWGRPLDTCMMDVRYRERFQDALATVLSDQARAGIDILTHGDLHCDDDMAGRSWHHYPIQRWSGFSGDYLQSEETRSPWLRYPAGTLLNEIYTGWRWPRVVDKIEHRPLDYAKIWRMAQAKASKPVRFGTCCSQVMGLFLDIHTKKYKDNREVIWDMAVAMNKELLALRDAGCKCIQIEEPTLHFWANTYGKDHDNVKFMIEAFNREVQGLDDVELWIHTCWGNPNMQRVIENDSYRESFQLYLEALRGDVWTVEMRDRNLREIELFAPLKGQLKKKIAVGVVSHRTLQVELADQVANSVRTALKHIAPEQLIVSSDCGFGRQGCNRDIAFFKTVAIAQGTNLVRQELGLPTTYIPAADPQLQTDIVPKTADR
ncbi:MAG TPA: cobalamin-independent methionine synthase II family protein [Verrucomicrobiota bacterium]|nr:cobalamin-independent methionine synthase II family protein [Verrucomicrobiota bacterium]HNT14653.1 cobalamin-independent methionine synthase II family protein [Verrucomicrobiota bacterium]